MLTPETARAWVVRYPLSDADADQYGDTPMIPRTAASRWVHLPPTPYPPTAPRARSHTSRIPPPSYNLVDRGDRRAELRRAGWLTLPAHPCRGVPPPHTQCCASTCSDDVGNSGAHIGLGSPVGASTGGPLRLPAALAKFESGNSSLQAVWGLVRHTLVAVSLDVNTDSNTRQRDLCHTDVISPSFPPPKHHFTNVEMVRTSIFLSYSSFPSPPRMPRDVIYLVHPSVIYLVPMLVAR